MTPRRIRAVAKKEMIQVLRDPRSLMVVLLMPLMQMALLGYGVNLDIKHVPICVFDREGSQQSESLMKAFQASLYFSIVETERDYAGLKRAIDAGRCKMAVVVPHDFSQTLATTNAASVQAILDATDDNTANIALGYAQAVVGAYSANVKVERTQTLGQPQPAAPAVTQYRVWFNEDLVSRDFIMPGVVALVLALVGAQLTSLTISREWERGTMEVLVSTPVTRMELMIGKILPYIFIGLVDAALCVVIAVFWFETPFRGALLTLFLTTLLFLIVVLGLGYFISASIRSQVGASQVALIATLLPTTLLSGFAFPIEQMPPIVQAITYLVPARYYFSILKAVFLKGSSLSDLVEPIAFLALYATVIGLLAARAFRKSLDETMWGRIFNLVLKEFLQLKRDRQARFRMTILPLIQMIIFGYAATFEVYHVSTIVLDLDHSQESRELISRFLASGRFQILATAARPADVRRAIDRGDAVVAVVVQAGFAEQLRKGASAPAQIIVDGTNSNTALIALSYVNQIVAAYSQEMAADLARRMHPARPPPPTVTLEQRPWYNVDYNSRWFFVPGVIATLTLVMIVNMTSFAVVREREVGTLEQIMVTPIRPLEFILGKTIPFFCVGVALVAVIAGGGTLWFQIPFVGNPLVLMLGTSLYLISVLGIGLLISTVCTTQQQAFATNFFVINPAFILSGFSFPIASMPAFMQWLSNINPMTYYLIIIRGTFLKGVGLSVLWPQMAALAAIGVALLGLSVLRFHKSLD